MSHEHRVPHAPISRVGPVEGTFPSADAWDSVPALSLSRAQDGADPLYPTRVRVLDDGSRLFVRFDCADSDVWATHTKRDAPLWEEEVVEVFLAAGRGVPTRYFEIEVNPLGALFDAIVLSPDGRRSTMSVDPSWDPPGIAVRVSRVAPDGWSAEVALPWGDCFPGATPAVLRANFFRVERPRNGAAEFSSWSPTWADPADFHRPEYFGILERRLADGLPEDS